MATKTASNLKLRTSRQYHDVIDSNLNLTDGAPTAVNFTEGITVTSTTIALVDDPHIGSVDGFKKFHVLCQGQAAVTANQGSALFTVGNTDISATSVIFGSVVDDGAAGGASGSALGISVKANTMSFAVHSTAGENIANDQLFTASFVIIN
jgi:hypothetical protein